MVLSWKQRNLRLFLSFAWFLLHVLREVPFWFCLKFVWNRKYTLPLLVDMTLLHTSPSSICVATSLPVLAGTKKGVGGLSKNASVWHSTSTSIIRSLISSRYSSRNKMQGMLYIGFFFNSRLFLITVLGELYAKNAVKLFLSSYQKNKTKCKLKQTNKQKPSGQFAM